MDDRSTERSRGGVSAAGGEMGRHSASSAQLKHVSRGETARLRLNWGELGQIWGGWDAGGEREVLAGADIDVGDAGGVYRMVDVNNMFLGFLGQAEWDAFRGGSGGSGSVFRHF
jgi:hypothetical protein